MRSASGGFGLRGEPILNRRRAGGYVVRGGRPREDAIAAEVLPVDERGRFPIVLGDDGRPRLRLVPADMLRERGGVGVAFVGERSGVDVWAARVGALPGGDRGADLRTTGQHLPEGEAALAATALAVLNWHEDAGRMPGPAEMIHAGWAVRIGERTEFPRTDPAVICLVHDGADHVLLARQNQWPERRFSVLAGFVEAGESLEHAVEREVEEEVGVLVSDVTYLGSQPWPFPRSLMIGFHARADRTSAFSFGDGEIAEADWYHRDVVLEALASGEDFTTRGAGGGLLLPSPVSIAHGMLEAWAYADRGTGG